MQTSAYGGRKPLLVTYTSMLLRKTALYLNSEYIGYKKAIPCKLSLDKKRHVELLRNRTKLHLHRRLAVYLVSTRNSYVQLKHQLSGFQQLTNFYGALCEARLYSNKTQKQLENVSWHGDGIPSILDALTCAPYPQRNKQKNWQMHTNAVQTKCSKKGQALTNKIRKHYKSRPHMKWTIQIKDTFTLVTKTLLRTVHYKKVSGKPWKQQNSKTGQDILGVKLACQNLRLKQTYSDQSSEIN